MIFAHFSQGSARHRLAASLLCLTFSLLPFSVLTLVVWGRNLWTDWRYPFAADHNPLHIVPLLGIIELSGSEELKRRILCVTG